jgi:hypothetical protein
MTRLDTSPRDSSAGAEEQAPPGGAPAAYLPGKLVFVHVMKTAGTSLYRWLQRHYRHDDILTEASNWLGYWAMPEEILARKRFVRGHFGSYITHYHNAANGFRTITVLRDPVERAVSHYFHGKSAPDAGRLGKIIRAENLSLDDYLEHPGCAAFARNFQVRNFAYDLSARYNTEKLAPAQFFKRPMAEADLRNAQSFLEQADLVGYTEELGEFVEALSGLMGFVPEENLGSSRGYRQRGLTLSPDTEKRLRNANALDIELYEWARRKIARPQAKIMGLVRKPPVNPIDLSGRLERHWSVMEPFFGTGWSDVQSSAGVSAPPHRWTIDREDATLSVKVDPGATYKLRVNLFRFASDEQSRQFSVLADGNELELSQNFRIPLTTGRTYTTTFGPTRTDECVLTFRVKTLKSFNTLNPSDDDRTLRGLALCSLDFMKIDGR